MKTPPIIGPHVLHRGRPVTTDATLLRDLEASKRQREVDGVEFCDGCGMPVLTGGCACDEGEDR